MDSILLTVKKALGVETDYDGFDNDIVIGINSAFFNLNQLNVGPVTVFSITGIDEVWTSFTGIETDLEVVKNYIISKTRLIFDPPTTAHMIEAMKNQIQELEWRMMIYKDPEIPDEEEEVV